MYTYTYYSKILSILTFAINYLPQNIALSNLQCDLFNIWPLRAMTITQKNINLLMSLGSNDCKIQNKQPNSSPKTFIICQSGII